MKKIIVLTTIFCLYFQFAAVVFAAAPNFAGNWELDLGKSKFPAATQIESMTMKVMQTEKELKVESTTKRSQNEARGGGMRRGGDGTQTAVYNLNGKEATFEINSGAATPSKETRKATVTADGKLSLTAARTFSDGIGSVTVKTNEMWELADAGKVLKVTRYMETPRGATNAELYFTKKSSTNTSDTETKINSTAVNQTEKIVSASETKVFGSVKVRVTIDEKGSVISAKAIDGPQELRVKAEESAKKASFAPTLLAGNPVKVTGVIVYNFVP